jgi:hypothetical protein
VLISTYLYTTFVVFLIALAWLARPIRRLGLPTRRRAGTVSAGSLLLMASLLALPARDHRVARPATRLDDFMPVWQFREFHTRTVDAPPPVVFDAIKRVRSDEILLFRRRFARIHRNSCVCEQRGGTSSVRGVLACDLPWQRAHPADVPARHRASCHSNRFGATFVLTWPLHQ